jgi:hypothetical protein
MKRLIIGTMISVMIIIETNGQTSYNQSRTRYGLELSQFITGSGFASGTEIYITVVPDHKKNISLGLYFCPEQKKITGITIHHERTLRRYADHQKVVPYAFYNMIYRITKTREVLADKSLEGPNATYKSLEHHLGLGIRIVLAKDLCFKSALGYGVYLGSIKKPSASNPVTGEIMGTNGFGAIAKVGFAYTF